MTPRQAAAWATLGAARTRAGMSAQLTLARMAAHGNNEQFQKQLREWNDGG